MAQIHISDKAWKHLATKKIEDPKKYPSFESILDELLFGEEVKEEVEAEAEP